MTRIPKILAVLALAVAAAPVRTAAAPLHVYASALVHNYPQWQPDSEFEVGDSEAGPIAASADAGYVIDMYHPDLRMTIEGTLFASAGARADYGVNGVFVESNLRAVTGDDRSAFTAIELLGGPLRVEMSTESIWSDTFVIEGGEGIGTANVGVTLGGFAQTRYGANGDVWYAAGLESYGASGYGFAQYGLGIDYAHLPEGLDEEYSQPIRWNEDYLPPVPAFVQHTGPLPPGTIFGSFVFEYGVPFSLTSALSVSGYNEIAIDFDHTATLSQILLPAGASLASGSGHLYPVSAVPEPATAWLSACGLLGLAGVSRRLRAADRRRRAGAASGEPSRAGY
jgi:hypothetical protein